MSRTYKKKFGPIGIVKSGQVKKWKRTCNKNVRGKVKILLTTCEDCDNLTLPINKELSDVWDSPTDGKTQYE